MNIRGSRTTYKLIAAAILMLILVACGGDVQRSNPEPDPGEDGGQEAVFAESIEPFTDYLCTPGQGYVTDIYGTGMGSSAAVERNPATLTFDNPGNIQ